MLAKQLHKHIDEMDSIETKAQANIENIINSIDIGEVIADPHKAMQEAVEEIRKVMIDEYIEMAAKQGIGLARLLNRFDKEGKEILIDPSKDGTKNKEVVND